MIVQCQIQLPTVEPSGGATESPPQDVPFYTIMLEVDPNEPVELLMVLIEVETGIPLAAQRLVARGRRLQPEASLISQLAPPQQGVDETAPLLVTVRNHEVPQHPLAATSNASSGAAGATRLATEPSADELINQLFSSAPSGASTLRSQAATAPPTRAAAPNADALITQLFSGAPVASLPNAAARSAARVEDPDDPEVQRHAYEAIQKKNLEENLMHALEYTPEAFARVVMLYVPCTVNKHPVTAFVDSGAQMSVMSEALAEELGLMRLLDRRMGGVAKGVGECKILGRIHMAMVHLGGLVLPFSITVLERQDMGFLIGLDQLKRHQMVIDLQTNALRIGEASIPFLSEGELPPHLRGHGEEGLVLDQSPTPAPPTAPPHPKRQAATPPAGTGDVWEQKLAKLMELTQLPREMCEAVLKSTDGDVDAATLLLLE